VDVVIPMNIDIKDINILFPDSLNMDGFLKQPPMTPFSDEVVKYLNALSIQLNKDTRIKNYPDVTTFSFFCRKGNILQLKNTFMKSKSLALGRGIVFHIAPSNLPVNFAFSLISGLLSGNSNIVRVSSKSFEQVDIIIDAIKILSKLERHRPVSKRLAIVRYNRNSEGTSVFSSICDVRIIWGGDQTIKQVRNNELPPRSFDLTFADRYSICVINADTFVSENHSEKVVMGFYNDSYLFDQNACTSPHLLIWLGNKRNVVDSQNIFWPLLHDIVESKYQLQSILSVDKLTSFYNQAIHTNKIKRINAEDNLLWRVELKELPVDIDNFRSKGGYFSEYHASSLKELSTIINRKYQTLSYYGIKKSDFENFIKKEEPLGIDRFVPIGRTTDFSLTWDGYNLIDVLSRKIEII